MRILVTGNCGYIGSHVTKELVQQGHELHGIDNLYRGSISNLKCTTHIGDIRDINFLDEVFEEFKPELVCHFAALTSVPESMEKPELYYEVNVEGTKTLLEVMKKHNCSKFIFSSTASVYEQSKKPVKETDALQPLNNYAKNKLEIELLIRDNSHWLSAIIFRYFNVIGWDDEYDATRELEKTNIVPALYKCHLSGEKFKIFGNKFPVVRKNPNDHTGVRDYIDVRDIALAYNKAIDRIQCYPEYCYKQEIFNLGTKTGYSVLELYNLFNQVNMTNIEFELHDKRKGDPAIVIADSQRARELLNWEPKYPIEKSLQII